MTAQRFYLYLKGHIALVGIALTLIGALWPGSSAAHDAAIALGVLTAAGVYVAPRTPPKAKKDAGLSLVEAIVAIAVAGFVLWLILRHVH